MKIEHKTIQMERTFFIICCRAEGGLCDPKIFKTEDEANRYVYGQLASMVRNYLHENEMQRPSEKIWKSDEKLVSWAEEEDIVIGLAFAAYSDWTEFSVTEVTLPKDFS